MIYPTNTGKSGEHLRLTTLESVWIQGKLRMWGALVVYWRWQVREYVQSVVGIQKTDENSH